MSTGAQSFGNTVDWWQHLNISHIDDVRWDVIQSRPTFTSWLTAAAMDPAIEQWPRSTFWINTLFSPLAQLLNISWPRNFYSFCCCHYFDLLFVWQSPVWHRTRGCHSHPHKSIKSWKSFYDIFMVCVHTYRKW